jgi:hypothetical protein
MKNIIFGMLVILVIVPALAGCSSPGLLTEEKTEATTAAKSMLVPVSVNDTKIYPINESTWKDAHWDIGANYQNDCLEFGIKSAEAENVRLEACLSSDNTEVKHIFSMQKGIDAIWRAKLYSPKMLSSYTYKTLDKNGNETSLSY